MIKYKINILEELANAGYNTSRLRKEKLFTESTIQRFRHGGVLSLKSLDSLCCLLKVQPGDIIEYVDDNIWCGTNAQIHYIAAMAVAEGKDKWV